MLKYIIRRMLWLLVVLLGISVITFLIAYLVPVDPARVFAGPKATPAQVANVRHQMGLDRPLYVQYALYLWHAVQGDFGWSYYLSQNVLPAIMQRFPATLELAVAGVFMELAIGIPIGLVSALHPRRLPDRVGTTFALFGLSVPPFWLGLVLIYIVGYALGWLPIGGYGSGPPSNVPYVVLPALTVGLGGGAYYARLLRTSLLEVMRADFVRTARSKGLSGNRVLYRHIFTNAITALVTQLGLDLGYFLGGILVIEVVFAWPGIGLQAWQAIGHLDVPMIMGTVLFAAACIAALNLIVDLLYAVLDPRVRLS